MNIEKLNQLRRILIDNNKSVSELEYTKNNYDDSGNLINEDIPTITTEYCEVGLYEGEIYLVSIIESKTFNEELFNEVRNKSNVKMYGFADFNNTLYPASDFKFDNFVKSIQIDQYLQIQFDFKNISAADLFAEYIEIVKTYKRSGTVVVNQLKTDLIAGL